MFFLFLIALFLLSRQPFQIAILIIVLMLFLLNFIYLGGFFPWIAYIIIMVYLGGLLILFVYFTRILSFFKKINFGVSIVGVFCIFSACFFIEKDQGCSSFSEPGILAFSTWRGIGTLFLVLALLGFILIIVRFFRKLSAPLRQQYEKTIYS